MTLRNAVQQLCIKHRLVQYNNNLHSIAAYNTYNTISARTYTYIDTTTHSIHTTCRIYQQQETSQQPQQSLDNNIHTIQQHQQQSEDQSILPYPHPNYPFPVEIQYNNPVELLPDPSDYVKLHAHAVLRCKIIIKEQDIVYSGILTQGYETLHLNVIKKLVSGRYNEKKKYISFTCKQYHNNPDNERQCFKWLDQVLQQSQELTKQFIAQQQQQNKQ